MTNFRQKCLLNDQVNRNMTNLWALPVPTVLEKTRNRSKFDQYRT